MKTIWIIGACLLVGICSACYWFDDIYRGCFESYRNASSISNHGEFGDKYGALNTLFTGLAFVGLIITILLQRKEMQDTRAEFEEQTKQLLAQAQIAKEQTYNTVLFEYLSYINQRQKDATLDLVEALACVSAQFHDYVDRVDGSLKSTSMGSLALISMDTKIPEKQKELALKKLCQNIFYLDGWANIAFEWEKYIVASDLSPEKKKDLFSRFWNNLYENERCSVVLSGVYTGKIQKNESDALLGFSKFKELCVTSSDLVVDIMFDLLSSGKNPNLEEIVRKHLPEDIIIPDDAF